MTADDNEEILATEVENVPLTVVKKKKKKKVISTDQPEVDQDLSTTTTANGETPVVKKKKKKKISVEPETGTQDLSVNTSEGEVSIVKKKKKKKSIDVTEPEVALSSLSESVSNPEVSPPTISESVPNPETDAPVVKKKKKKIVKKIVKKKKKKSFLDDILAKEDEILDRDEDSQKIRFRPYTMDDFRLVRLLGEGGFGAVYLAKLVGHRHYFALKFLSKATIIEMDDFDALETERKVMQLGNQNPFICRIFSSFQTDRFLCMAMEFCFGGSLKFHLDQERRFPVQKTRFYLAQLICVLEFLHKRGYIYRDLKLENVMITNTGNIKLVDFGMCSGKIYREEMQPTEFAGTVEYMAPEVIKGNKYNQSVDYWSLGILAYEMALGFFPFTGTDEDELCWMICNQNVSFPSVFIQENPDLRSLIQGLLTKTAPERLGMDTCALGKLRYQPFFSALKWSDVENLRCRAPFIPSSDIQFTTGALREMVAQYFGAQPAQPHHIIDLTKAPEPTLEDDETTRASLLLKHPKFETFDYTNPFLTD